MTTRTTPKAKAPNAKAPTAKAPTAKPPRPRRAAGGSLEDPALRAAWDATLARYRAATREEMAGWDERYEALGEILDRALYLAGGFKSEGAFLAAEAPGLSDTSARRYIRIAKHFDPEHETDFGVSKLDLLLDYLEAHNGGVLAKAQLNPRRQTILVPGPSATEPRRPIPFAKATAADLRSATRAAKGLSQRPDSAASPVEKALRASLTKAKLGEGEVRVRRESNDLIGVPGRDVPALGVALSKVKMPPA
jgi:hypothetical protein